MIDTISREEAVKAFAARHPSADPAEVAALLEVYLDAGCLDFIRDDAGEWQVRRIEPKRLQ